MRLDHAEILVPPSFDSSWRLRCHRVPPSLSAVKVQGSVSSPPLCLVTAVAPSHCRRPVSSPPPRLVAAAPSRHRRRRSVAADGCYKREKSWAVWQGKKKGKRKKRRSCRRSVEAERRGRAWTRPSFFFCLLPFFRRGLNL
ncbi:hypothetical protein LINPERPRIM_LOCUS172 [Linum perenne]